MAIDDSALNGATWELEEPAAQALRLPRGVWVARLLHSSAVPSPSRCTWGMLTLKGMLQMTHLASPQG